jgi:hypothetical protein
VSVAPKRRRAWSRVNSVEAVLMGLAFVCCIWVARAYSTDVPGGADWWGYVSEAGRLSHGRFYEPERVLSRFGLPENSALTQPLGYTSKGRGGTVPIYPFGYPLLMAVAMLLGGTPAAFWVTAILAAGTVLVTYVLGRALLGRGGGVIAALLLALFPSLIWGGIQPLSDVPATFFCAVALVALLALPPAPLSDALLGAALGFGVWVRPNTGLLFVVIGAWLLLRREGGRLLRTAAALAPFLLVEAFVNWHLYGAPWRSGYGALALGGPPAEALARGVRYLLRLNLQQAGVGLALLVLALFWNRLAVARRTLLAALFGALLCFFAVYRIDDAWWYFRFLLPAMPAVVVLEGGLVARLAGPGRARPARVAAITVAVGALLLGEWRYGLDKHIYALKEGEQRYPNAARLAGSIVQRPALVLAMQHSGSLRYYSGLATARYDTTPPEELAATLLDVSRAGGRVYLVADEWELEHVVNSKRGFLLAGASQLGHVEPGYTRVFLLDPERAAERLRRGGAVRFAAVGAPVVDGDWKKVGTTWALSSGGTIRLPGDARPALARVCIPGSGLVLRRPGFPAAPLSPPSCADVPLLPGVAGALELAASASGKTFAGSVEVLPVSALRDQQLLSTAYMVPLVARTLGPGGGLWQTDLLLVNPQPRPLRVTGLLLRDGADNREAHAATTTVPPGAAVEVADVLGIPEFERLGESAALLVHAGSPANPCGVPACRFLVCARTHDALAPHTSAESAEWLPGLPASAALARGAVVFPPFPAAGGVRVSVGLASWSAHPLGVRVRFSVVEGSSVDHDVVVPPFGHTRVDLGTPPLGGRVELELRARAADARLFAYVWSVNGVDGATRALLPERMSTERPTGIPSMPRPLTSELARDL